jgi:hypothetical protein
MQRKTHFRRSITPGPYGPNAAIRSGAGVNSPIVHPGIDCIVAAIDDAMPLLAERAAG